MVLRKALVILTVVVSLAMDASAIRCEINEYYQTVLEQCHPCRAICDPLTRDDCVRRCGDYIKSLQACRIDQFWDRNRETCLPCTSICSPLNRTICINECSRFIKELEKTTALPDSTTSTRMPTELVVLVVGPIVLLFIFVFGYGFRQKIFQCLNCLVPVKQETLAIQETTKSPDIELRQQLVSNV